MTGRVAAVALGVLVVGLAFHNLAMSALWDAGLRGNRLDVVAGWKELVLLGTLGFVLWRVRRLPLSTAADRLALAYTVIVLLYAVIPQDWLGGEATTKGIFLALRHHLIPVAAYALGRLAGIAAKDARRLLQIAVGVAVGVAIVGLIDVYAIPLQFWRDSGVPGWYEEQLGLTYRGLSGLPENWVYNTGDEDNPIRRLVSTFLSPLAAAYVLVVAILYLASRPLTRWSVALAGIAYVGLLWTHTRAAFLALGGGLVVLALVQRRWWPAIAGAATVAVAAATMAAFPSIGPSTSYTAEELEILRRLAAQSGDLTENPFDPRESSTASHWRNLRDGIEVVIRHPQGYGLGNAGVNAKRTGVEIKAGESTYTELGVDAGLAGALAFIAWSLAALWALWRRVAWLTAAFAAVLVLGLQSDVIGVHWLAYCVWAAVGVGLSLPERRGEPASAQPATR